MKNIIAASEDLLKELERINKFSSKYGILPYKEAGRIAEKLKKLSETIPTVKTPKNQDELIQSELKRRLKGEAASLEHRLSGEHYDFDTVVSMYGIPASDISNLKTWLENNKEDTLESIERLFQTSDIKNYELPLPADIPSIRRQAEEFAAVHIQRYHKKIGKLLQDLTNVGEFLRDIDAVPTTAARSYFNYLTNTLAIGIPAICFSTEDSKIHIREKDLIASYGHEGMGHALNYIVTHSNELPYFLKKESLLTEATAESIAQFYQKIIFEDLKASKDTQKELGIEHKFNAIYQEEKDIRKLQEYQSKLFQYSITVLANKSLGEPQSKKTIDKKVELIKEVTLDPNYPQNFVEQKYNFDSRGNLTPDLVSELKYCAQPVQRALDEFKKQGIIYKGEGRSKIDTTLLKGFWTPIGFVENARLKARNRD